MGHLLETSMAAPFELLIVFATNVALVLPTYLCVRLYKRYSSSHWRNYEQESSSKLYGSVSRLANLFFRIVGNVCVVASLVLGWLYGHFPSVEWTDVLDAVRREAKESWTIIKCFYERKFSKKRRAMELERERRRQKLEEEEALRRREEERLRALQEYTREMDSIRMPGCWD